MKLKRGAYARWLARHLQTSVSAVARRAQVDLRDLRKVCRGVPKIVSAERMRGVYGAHRLTPAQFAWNVKIGWGRKRSFAPGGWDAGITRDEPGHGGKKPRSSAVRDSRWAAPAPLRWLCRADLCRLAGRCPAATYGDFSGRRSRACVEAPAGRARPAKRSRAAAAGPRRRSF